MQSLRRTVGYLQALKNLNDESLWPFAAADFGKFTSNGRFRLTNCVVDASKYQWWRF